MCVDLNALPADQRANFGMITPVAAVFKQIGGTAFGFMASGSFLKGDIKMLTEQRYQIILDLLKEKKSVTATELKEILDTSESVSYTHLDVYKRQVMWIRNMQMYIETCFRL